MRFNNNSLPTVFLMWETIVKLLASGLWAYSGGGVLARGHVANENEQTSNPVFGWRYGEGKYRHETNFSYTHRGHEVSAV